MRTFGSPFLLLPWYSFSMDAEKLIQFAEVHMLQAEFASETEREALLHDVQDALIQSEHVEAGSGAWLMACVHGRQGNSELCRRWLERARDAGRLPERSTIESSAHLKPVAELKWFREWLETLGD